MSKKDINYSGVSEGQIQAWKKEHVSVWHVAVGEDGKDQLHFFFKKPDMSTVSAATARVDRDPVGSNLIVFQNCLLNKDMLEYKDNVDVMVSIGPTLQQLIEIQATKVEKL